MALFETLITGIKRLGTRFGNPARRISARYSFAIASPPPRWAFRVSTEGHVTQGGGQSQIARTRTLGFFGDPPCARCLRFAAASSSSAMACAAVRSRWPVDFQTGCPASSRKAATQMLPRRGRCTEASHVGRVAQPNQNFDQLRCEHALTTRCRAAKGPRGWQRGSLWRSCSAHQAPNPEPTDAGPDDNNGHVVDEVAAVAVHRFVRVARFPVSKLGQGENLGRSLEDVQPIK